MIRRPHKTAPLPSLLDPCSLSPTRHDPRVPLPGGIGALLGALLLASLSTACPGSAGRGTTARPGAPKTLTFAFRKGQTEAYQTKLVFRARMDQLGTKETTKHKFSATFRLVRMVTSTDNERTCFQDRFSNARVLIDNLPPRVTDAVAKELDHARILWCLDRSGRLSMFSPQGLGPALQGLKLSSVLSRIYHLASWGSAQGKRLGDEWKQTTTNRQTIAGRQVRTDIQTSFAVMQAEGCRPSPLNSGTKGTKKSSRKDSRKTADCLEVLITEQGVIPDFDMTKGDRAFKMGGVIKGKASIVVDGKTGTWRAWSFRRVVGIAATTKVRGASADFGVRTDVLFLLTRQGH